MITALLIVTAIAFLFEIAGLLYCAIRNFPFGRAFGVTVFAQISIPVVSIATVSIWEHFSPTTGGADSFVGTGFDRSFQLFLVFLAIGFVATLVAGTLGFCRIFFHTNDQTRNA